MPEEKNSIIFFGETDFRNKRTHFGIKIADRRRHMYLVGKSGVGKSELLKIMAIQDIQAGRGLAFVDPHGDPVEDLLDYIPEERIKDVIYINPADLDFPIAFNVMEQVDPDKRHLVADGVMGVFKKIWTDVWSARMEYILNHAILALLEVPNSTLLGINRMFADKDFRNQIVAQVKDPAVKAFWTQEFAGYTDRLASDATAAIQNKVGQFVSSTLIRNIIGQSKSSFNIREAMDSNKIILVNVSKGRIGEDNSSLLGALLITRIQLAAMSRIDIPKEERKDFSLYVDEFQNFATSSFATILSEARKFNLSLIIGHQYIAQLDQDKNTKVRDAVFGNVGTLIAFRVGAEDAEFLEKEFEPEFMATDLVNLGKRQIYLKLLIDGISSRAFSATTMDTPPPLFAANRQPAIDASRGAYAGKKEDVEKMIVEWHAPITPSYGPEDRPRGNRSYGGGGRDGGGGRYGGGSARDGAICEPRPYPMPQQAPSQAQMPPPLAPQPAKPSLRPASLSLSEALKTSPMDFKGRRIQPREQKTDRPKPDVDLEGLRGILNKSMNDGRKN